MASFPDIPISYADFYAIDRGEHFLLRNELEKFGAMVRESPILSQIYNIDAESRVSDPRIGLARSNLLLQSEAFKFETSEIFSKIRQYNSDERIRMDNNSGQAYRCDPISHTNNIKGSCSVDL